MERILSMLGLAHKAGRVEIGEEPVGSSARAKKARVILGASDAAAGSVRRAMSCLPSYISTRPRLGLNAIAFIVKSRRHRSSPSFVENDTLSGRR